VEIVGSNPIGVATAHEAGDGRREVPRAAVHRVPASEANRLTPRPEHVGIAAHIQPGPFAAVEDQREQVAAGRDDGRPAACSASSR
jgi:hypothetical protein